MMLRRLRYLIVPLALALDGCNGSDELPTVPPPTLPSPETAPLVLINAVGLTHRLLPHAPRLQALATAGWSRSVVEAVPAVTTTAQATYLTGQPPQGHGIVGNGWFFRDTGE